MRWRIILLFITSILIGEPSERLNINGHIDFNYISRLSDYSIINLPYRLVSIKANYGSKNLLLQSSIAIEHQIRRDTDFLVNTSPTDFFWDLRELYLFWESKLGILKIGKQICSWGAVDDNSPLDVVNPLDYYYLFSSGTERKLATFSANFDIYQNNTRLNLVFSPIHNTNRIPINDPEFPIELPLVPESLQIFSPQKTPNEYGLLLSQKFSFADISFAYFNGFDRIYNFTGVNTWGQGSSLNVPRFDILFGYRKTEMFGYGLSFFNDFFTIRADFGLFRTNDVNNKINRNYPGYLYISSQGKYVEIFESFGYDSLHFSFPMNEKAEYWQTTLQLEAELPFSISLTGQLFLYDTISYRSDSLPVSDDIPLPVLDDMDFSQLNPKNFFTPGMGVPLAILSNRIGLINLEKITGGAQLKIAFSAMLDLDSYNTKEKIPGSLLSVKSEYNVYDNVVWVTSITRIKSVKNHPNGPEYRFKMMEDFSHFQMQIKYFF